jgi:hypothetical protein
MYLYGKIMPEKTKNEAVLLILMEKQEMPATFEERRKEEC